jgi:hypothetical protein
MDISGGEPLQNEATEAAPADETPSQEIIIREVTPKGRTGKPKRVISEAQREKARASMKLAHERKQYYKQVRQELGLGARDPIPQKYLKETSHYKPKVYEEKTDKEIVQPDEDLKAIKKEVGIKRVKQQQEKSLLSRDKALKQEAKEARIAKVVRDEVNDILTHRSAMKAHLKMEMKAEQAQAQQAEKAKKPDQDDHSDTNKKAKPAREPKRFRLADGRVLEV